MQRPQVKPEHTPYRTAGARIRIGGVAYGAAAELEDPTGAVWTMLGAADGTRSPHDILTTVRGVHPDLDPQWLESWLDTLCASPHLEDAGAAAPAAVTSRDRIRHDRGRRLLRWMDPRPGVQPWAAQARLRASTAVVLGVGGTGAAAATALAASGVGRLVLVDGDHVELSNLGRQVLYTEADVGQPKTEVAAARLRSLNRDIAVDVEARRVELPAEVAALAAAADVLLLCADTPRDLRIRVNRGCLQAGTAWVDAGYHGPLVQASAYTPGTSACWECVRTVEADRHRAIRAVGADTAAAAVHPNAVNAVSAGMSGHLAAHLAISLLTGIPALHHGTVYTINLLNPAATPVHHSTPQRADCPACGNHPGGPPPTPGRNPT
ncbi:ThiF family adenylyltransferase [Krasilnikovia sp. MM14-A1259]|uniref:ThiF family adenylyltransferase n=1 Tax=Krasilnikovia sp. MM14-A1259 TaxID=3373539 RepID=UPI00399C8646